MVSLPIPCLNDKGFETKGGANEADFFGSFGIASSSSTLKGDGYDAAFDASAWGDTGGHQEETGIEVSLETPATDSADEAQRKEKARRRREGPSGSSRTSSRNSKTTSETEAGMESLTIDGSRSRSRRPDEARQRYSGSGGTTSQSGGGRSSATSDRRGGGTADPPPSRVQAPTATSSFKKMFQRSKAPDP